MFLIRYSHPWKTLLEPGNRVYASPLNAVGAGRSRKTVFHLSVFAEQELILCVVIYGTYYSSQDVSLRLSIASL